MEHLDPDGKDPEDRREVDPPIEVESATWASAGTLEVGQRAPRVVGARPRCERSSQMDQSC
jgi:hypothetical protein